MVATIAVALVISSGFSAAPAYADSWFPITGTGSTWSQNALDQWRRNVANNNGMTVNYSGVGSSAGRRDFIAGTVDFAISEIPFQSRPEDNSAPENASNYAYMPIVAGGTAFMYNLKIGGKKVTNLRLSGDTVTKIFTNVITNWNDPAIKADNPGLAMPDKQIIPVVRSDGSGSTAQFTLWMLKQYPDMWKSYSGLNGLTSQYPVKGGSMKAQNGSLGVAGYVQQSYGEGAITYVEYSYALKSGFPVAKVLNQAGYYVEPTASAVAVALLSAQINTDPSSGDYLTQILDGVYNSADKRTYPLSSYSYMIVPTAVGGVFNADKGKTLGAFAKYALCEGQQQASALGYSPLPMNLVLAGFEQIKRIPGAAGTNLDSSTCHNPTFKVGDSPSKNQLALTADQPADCDKKGGPTQCTAGTGGATGTSTATTGSSPTAGSGAGGGTSAAGGGGAAAAADAEASGGGVAPVYDVNGALVGGGGSAGGATSSPFTLASAGFGTPQALMIGAGVLLIGIITVPPFFWRRLKVSKTSKK